VEPGPASCRPATPDADDEFGRSVAIAGDLIAIGAHREDGIGSSG
jgi:hypothetical protein